jgi:hypothetical protein
MSNLIISGGVTLSGGFSAEMGAGGGGGGILPLPVTGSVGYWFTAGSLNLADGASVTSWSDQQGGEPLVPLSTAPTFVSNAINGKPAVMNTSTSSPSTLGRSTGSSPGNPYAPSIDRTTFVVAKALSTTGVQQIYADGQIDYYHPTLRMNGTGLEQFQVEQSAYFPNGEIRQYGTVGTSAFIATEIINNNVYNGEPSLKNSTLFLNGVKVFHHEWCNLTPYWSHYSPVVRVFGVPSDSGAGGGTGFNGYVAEIIVYDRVLTTQETADVHSYLAAKYGIQVVSQENLGSGVGYISGMPITNLSRIATGTGSSVASQSTPLHLVAYHLSNGTFTGAQIDEFVTTGHISGAPVVVSPSGWDETPVSNGYSGVMLGAKAGEIRRFTWSQYNSDCLIKLVNFV